MKRLILFLMVCYTLSSCFSARINSNSSFTLPAEWEPHQAVWVGLFQRPGRDTVTAQIIHAIHRNVKVKINYDKDSARLKYNSFFHSFSIDTSKLEWIKDSVLFVWMRDPGPLFLRNKKGELKVLDFAWNSYGNIYLPGTSRRLNRNDSLIGRIDSRMGVKLNIPVVSTKYVAEGGGIESILKK